MEDCPHVLELILSDILNKEVKVEEFVPTELRVKKASNKLNCLDVLVKTKEGKIINVEFNNTLDPDIKDRNLIYYTSIYSQKTKMGTINTDCLMQINLNRRSCYKDNLKKEEYMLKEVQNGRIYSKNFKIISINIDKYKKFWYDENIKGNKKHIYLTMLGANKKELEELAKVDEIVKEVKEKVFILNDDGAFIRTISREEENMLILKEKLERNKERYIRKGEKKGIAEGMQQGRIEEKISNAKAMLEKNMPIKDIMEITNLPENEILKLAE